MKSPPPLPTHIYMHAHTHTYTCTHTHIYMHAHTHTHIYSVTHSVQWTCVCYSVASIQTVGTTVARPPSMGLVSEYRENYSEKDVYMALAKFALANKVENQLTRTTNRIFVNQ
jgi:hypothetical protein